MFQDTIQTCPLPKPWVSFVDQGSSVLGARVEPEALVKTIKCLVWLIPAPDRAGFSGWLARVFFCLCPSDQAGQTWVISLLFCSIIEQSLTPWRPSLAHCFHRWPGGGEHQLPSPRSALHMPIPVGV